MCIALSVLAAVNVVNVWPSNVAKKQGEHRLGTVFVYVLMRRNTGSGNTALVHL